MDKWKEKRRVGALNKVNRELESLKKKEHFFEKKDSYAAKIEVPVRVKDSVKKLKMIAIVLFLLWAITLFVYMGKVANLKVENNELSDEVSLKTVEVENLESELESLNSEVEDLKESEGDINDDYNDLKDLNDLLEDQIDDLGDQVNDLNTNLTTQLGLVSQYEACIVDINGFNSSLSTCSSY